MSKWYLVIAAEKHYYGRYDAWHAIIDKFSSIEEARADAEMMSQTLIYDMPEVSDDLHQRAKAEVMRIIADETDYRKKLYPKEMFDSFLIESKDIKTEDLPLLLENPLYEDCFDALVEKNMYYQIFEPIPEVVEKLEDNYPAWEKKCMENPFAFAEKYCIEA